MVALTLAHQKRLVGSMKGKGSFKILGAVRRAHSIDTWRPVLSSICQGRILLASSVPLPRRLTVFLAALGKVLPAGQRPYSSPGRQ